MTKNDIESSQKKSRPSFLKSLPKTQRYSFIVLVIISVGILGLWFWQINYRLSSALGISTKAPRSLEQETENFQQLATLDTDGDGLTDVEERTIYNTSAFLADTDGDGISDYDEIKMGTDPLCRAGESCDKEIVTPPKSQENIIVTPNLEIQPTIQAGDLETMMTLIMSGEANAQEVRAFMLATGGADPELINSLSDEEILATYKETLNQQVPLVE